LTEQITHLEADAQKRTPCGSTDAFTFASAADIHAHAPPAESTDGYRPAPMLPEMPVRLVGSRDARVRSAELLAARAGELTRGMENLLAVRATAVHQPLIEKSRKIELTERWARDSAERVKGLLSAVPNRRAAEAVSDIVLTATARADLETNRWEYLL